MFRDKSTVGMKSETPLAHLVVVFTGVYYLLTNLRVTQKESICKALSINY